MRKAFLVLSFLTAAAAWHPTGHFIVARIAEAELLKAKPALLKKMLDLLKVLGQFTKEADHPFVESACFVDDIKAQGWKAFNAFHFYDYYIAGPGSTPADLAKLPKSSVNMASAIADARETLRNTRTTQVDDRLGKSLMLRFLVHLVGDVHQPLHSTSRVTPEHPRGDAGGNAFKLRKPSTDLHSYWDKTLGFFPDVRAPLDERSWAKVTAACDDLVKRYPRSAFEEQLKKPNPSDWIKEGKDLVSKFAYKDLEENGEVSEAYRERARPVIERQLALGGYRLTDYLLATFKDESIDDYFAVHQNKKASDSSDSDDSDANVKADSSDDKTSGDEKPDPKTATKTDPKTDPKNKKKETKDEPAKQPAKTGLLGRKEDPVADADADKTKIAAKRKVKIDPKKKYHSGDAWSSPDEETDDDEWFDEEEARRRKKKADKAKRIIPTKLAADEPVRAQHVQPTQTHPEGPWEAQTDEPEETQEAQQGFFGWLAARFWGIFKW